MDSLDKLLDQLKAEYDESAKPKQSKPQQSTESFIQPFNFVQGPPLSNSASPIDNLLAEVKAQYEEQDRVEELRRQQELQQQQIRQQQLQAQQLKALKIRAQAWIDRIEPLSSEGLWFEKFAEKYPSKLEAALDYLQGIDNE